MHFLISFKAFGSLSFRMSIIPVKRLFFFFAWLVFHCIAILSFREAKLEVTYILYVIIAAKVSEGMFKSIFPVISHPVT